MFAVYEGTVLAVNRDFYVYTPSFNGTNGVGSGTQGSRPSSCTSGVAYWATDMNTLYKCTAPNTWTAYYTPYSYPHPLTTGTSGTGGTVPSPPTNLRISSE